MPSLEVGVRALESAKCIKSKPVQRRCDVLRAMPPSRIAMAYAEFARLPDGYEIRQLTREHLKWVRAIVGHTMSFDSPLWRDAPYEGGATQRAYDMYHAMKPSSKQCIDSGLSYGVFIKDWTKSEAKLRWNVEDPSCTRDDLLKQMDFPLVSVAMSKDLTADKLGPRKKFKSWAEIVPPHGTISRELKRKDESRQNREVKHQTPQAGDVVRRSGTHTHGDHAGKGLARALAHFVMDRMAEKGYGKILIHTGDAHVHKVWANPPAPHTAVVGAVFETANHVEAGPETEGKHNPFGRADVTCSRIWVLLGEGRKIEKTSG